MTRTTQLAWREGVKALPGTMIRFKDAANHRWQYAIFRGRDGNAYTFSDTPDGAIVTWMMVAPRLVEVAVVDVCPGEGEKS